MLEPIAIRSVAAPSTAIGTVADRAVQLARPHRAETRGLGPAGEIRGGPEPAWFPAAGEDREPVRLHAHARRTDVVVRSDVRWRVDHGADDRGGRTCVAPNSCGGGPGRASRGS